MVPTFMLSSFSDIESLHQYVDHVPHMKAFSNFEKYPICKKFKMQKTARGYGDPKKHDKNISNGISSNWNFLMQTSKDTTWIHNFHN